MQSLQQQEIDIRIPTRYTNNLTLKSLLTMVSSITKSYPGAIILLYIGKGTLSYKYEIDGDGNVTGDINNVHVKDSEETKQLVQTNRSAFVINKDGNNFQKKELTIIPDIENSMAMNARNQKDIVCTHKFDATLDQGAAFDLELETMKVVNEVQAKFPTGKVIRCNEIVDRKAGKTAKSTTDEDEDRPGVVFTTAYIVPVSQLGTNVFFNSDRKPDFLKKIAEQIPGVPFGDISRKRSKKQKERCDQGGVVKIARHAERRAEKSRADKKLAAQMNAAIQEKTTSLPG